LTGINTNAVYLIFATDSLWGESGRIGRSWRQSGTGWWPKGAFTASAEP